MNKVYSQLNDGILERWFIRLELTNGGQPLPNIIDFGLKSIIVNYTLFNKNEYDIKLGELPNVKSKSLLEKNSIMFDSEGGLPWQVSAQCSMPLEFPITKKEYEEAYSLVVWADPFGSAAFFGEGYWKGVLIVKEVSQLKTEEIVGKTKKNVIHIKLKVAQSVISYFIDLVEKYTTPNFPILQKMHDALKNGDDTVLGILGVMAPSIGDNDNSLYAIGINSAEVIYGEPGVDLYDGYYWIFERVNSGNFIKIEWGDSNISIYDFKAPIKKFYAEMIRIGNDSRIYSNEGLSNLNWGIVGYQLELGPERMIKFAKMDPRSTNEPQDDEATRDGQRAGEAAGGDQASDKPELVKYPKPLDRRKLFLFITKVISENDLYTWLGVLKHADLIKNSPENELREKMQNSINQKKIPF